MDVMAENGLGKEWENWKLVDGSGSVTPILDSAMASMLKTVNSGIDLSNLNGKGKGTSGIKVKDIDISGL